MWMNWALPVTLDGLKHDLAPQTSRTAPESVTPRADVLETEAGYELVVEMPGVTREGLEVQLEDDVLTLRGARQVDRASAHLLVNDRWAERPFVRRFTLGGDVDRDRIQARLENGMLHLTLPRKDELKPRKIDIA